MLGKRFLVLLLGVLIIFQESRVCYGAADEDSKESDDADVQVEDEKSDDAKKDGETKGDSDSDKKEGDESKAEDDEQAPETINIDGREIKIERADRTVTAEVKFEISFGNEVMGNITFGLFGKQCPKTVRNFVTLANPRRKNGEGYKGSKIHRIVRGFAIQGGDYINNDGSGGWSIYGRYFRDENFAISHFPFCLSMANSGPNSNGSQFFVPLIRTKWLDGKHVVFGQVEEGHKLIKDMNSIRVNRYNRPLRQVWISDTWTHVKKLQTTKTEL